MKSAFKWLVPIVLVCLAIFGSVTYAKEQIVFGYMGNAQEAAAYEQVIADFNRQQSDIEVIGRHIFGDYFDVLIMQIAGGVAPDIFQVYTEEFMRPFQKSGWLLDLTPFVQDEEFDFSDFPPGMFDAAYYEGGLYALPRDVSVRVMFYNRDLYQMSGIPEPGEDTTWDDTRTAMKMLTRKGPDGQYTSVGLEWGSWWPSWMPMVWMWGGEVTDPDMTEITLNTPEALGALNFMAQAMREGWMNPPESVIGDVWEGWAQSRLAMRFDGHWIVGWARDVSDFDWDVAPVPLGPAGRYTTFGSNWYGVYSKTQHPEAAAEFVKYLVGEGNRIYTSLGGIVPSRLSLMMSDDFMRGDLPSKNRDVWLNAALTAKWPPITDVWGSLVDETISPTLQDAFRGTISVEQAVEQIRMIAPSILEQAN